MAVNVNEVYKTVLLILNKEQRGYITPNEFNKIATQVQLEIFESYFADGDQFNRKNQQNTENDTEFFNSFYNLENKLIPFITDEGVWAITGSKWNQTLGVGDRAIYKVGSVYCNYTSTTGGATLSSIEAQRVSFKELKTISKSKLTAPSNNYPLYSITSATGLNNISTPYLNITPVPNSITVNGIIKPLNPFWGYTVGSQGQYLYDTNTSVNFELIEDEQTNLIIQILKYAGVIINDPQIVQAAGQQEMATEANEKR